MKITTKIISYSVGMLLILTLAITIPSTIISIRTQQNDVKNLESTLRNNFDEVVKQEVETVISLLASIHEDVNNGIVSYEEAELKAANLVRDLRYGKDGYFWIDTKEGINVVLLGNNDVEGKSRIDLVDAKGNKLIQNIIQVALDGGGYTEYWFPKKGETVPLPKRSYSAYFEPFNWVIGTGNYIDDIEVKVNEVKEAQLRELKKALTQTILIALITLILFGFLAVLFGRRITRSIINLSRQTEEVSNGNLALQIKQTEKDEIGVLQASLQKTINQLKAIIEDIIEGSNNVFAASEQMAQSAEHISTGANSQAASTEEISSSVEEMVSNIQSNANNAQRTEQTANRANKGIEELQSTVKRNLEAMQTISEKVSVIKDIATQTNLLALNASVEASRAGDAGKGFSVVAAEVRKLSEVTQKAASDIGDLSVSSLEIAENSWAAMEELLPEIIQITQMIKEILASSNEQEMGANHINSAIQSLVSITSQNSASSEEMASSSEELSRQAELLKETISYFKTK